jgi:hypothetical protein
MAAATPVMAAAALIELAWALARRDDPRQAARLLGAGAAFLDHTGIALQRTDITCRDATMDAPGERLDTAELATLLATGRDRGLHVAIEHARPTPATAEAG